MEKLIHFFGWIIYLSFGYTFIGLAVYSAIFPDAEVSMLFLPVYVLLLPIAIGISWYIVYKSAN